MPTLPIFGSAAASPAQHAALHQALQRIHQRRERARAQQRHAAYAKTRLRGLTHPTTDGFAECTSNSTTDTGTDSPTITDFLLIALAATALLLLAGYALITMAD